MDLTNSIRDAVAATEPEMLAWMLGLVRTPSTFGQETEAQRYVANGYASAGLDVQVFEPSREFLFLNPYATRVPWDYQGRPNVVATWSGRGGGRSIILNGHIDVVDPGPPEDWETDPWQPVHRDGYVYGRGAADMKAGLTQMLWAVRALQATGVRLQGDVILQSVLEEENTGNGTLACCLRGITADAALIAEPTGQRIRLAQSSICGFSLEVGGQVATHLPRHLRVNPHDVAVWLAGKVIEYQDVRNGEVRHPVDADIVTPTLCSVSRISGAEWPDHVALRCAVEGRLAGLPNESVADLRRRFAAYIEDVSGQHPWLKEHPVRIKWIAKQVPGSMVAAEEPFIHEVAAAHERIVGRPVGHQVAVGYCDMWQFQHVLGIPVTAYGPIGENSHAPNERVSIASVQEAAAVTASLLMSWCGVATEG